MSKILKNYTCCFTGHRKITSNIFLLKYKLKKAIVSLIEKGVIYFGSGGAIGFDTLAALTVLELKKKYPQIKLIMILPCKNQELKWSEKDKKQYYNLLELCDKKTYVSEYYHRGCMHKRNRYLVDNSRYCIAYLNQNTGGTYYTVNYAIDNHVQVINLS